MEEFNLEEFRINFGINNRASDWEIFNNQFPDISLQEWIVIKKNEAIWKLVKGEPIHINDNGITVDIASCWWRQRPYRSTDTPSYYF